MKVFSVLVIIPWERSRFAEYLSEDAYCFNVRAKPRALCTWEVCICIPLQPPAGEPHGTGPLVFHGTSRLPLEAGVCDEGFFFSGGGTTTWVRKM